MPTRRTVILVAAFLAAAFGAASAPLALSLRATAADASALAFVTDIYSAYKGKDAKGHPLDDERAIRRYFEPSLAALMVKDQKIAAKRGEVGSARLRSVHRRSGLGNFQLRYRGRRHRARQGHRHGQIHQLR